MIIKRGFMSKKKILAVDDEENILELIRYNLSKEGYLIEAVSTGEEAMSKALVNEYDLILLDLMLPGIDGFEVCRQLKANPKTNGIPVIMITAKGEESDIVAGLELGAEDYVIKPFSPRVLNARVRTVLRRKKPKEYENNSVVRIHGISIDPKKHEVTIKGKKIELTATEFQLLMFFSRHPSWVFTRNQIIEAIKGDDYPVTDRSVDVQIVGLRKKLGSLGDYIETVRGVGYRFKE